MTTPTPDDLLKALEACEAAMLQLQQRAEAGQPLSPIEAHAFQKAQQRARVLVMRARSQRVPPSKARGARRGRRMSSQGKQR